MIRFSDYSGMLLQRDQRITCGLFLGRAALLLVAGQVFQEEEFGGVFTCVGVVSVLVLAETMLDRSKGKVGITPGYLWAELVMIMLLPLLPLLVWGFVAVSARQGLDIRLGLGITWGMYRSVFLSSPWLVTIYLLSTLGVLMGLALVRRRFGGVVVEEAGGE